MIPKRYKDEEYICGKCGRKVGFFVITGHGENDWGYHKDNFCQSCGEKVEWLSSREEIFTIYLMKRYKCGHFEFTRERIVLHPEEYGVTVPIAQCKGVSKNCPICEAKYKMDRAMDEYKRSEMIYQKYKAVQESGKNFFDSVSDEMKETMFERMKNEDNVV